MKICGLTIIKNEEQIIELFCRHNLNLLDKLYIIDNCSFDNTVEIVESLIKEGLNIELTKGYPDTCHNQEVALTDKIKTLEEDWVFLLDADEFIDPYRDKKTFLLELKSLKTDICYSIRWKTYVPTEILTDTDNFLKKITKRRAKEPVQFGKAVVPKNIIDDSLQVTTGNHHIRKSGQIVEQKRLLSVNLSHFPIRTRWNTIHRILLNQHTLSTKNNREDEEGRHWDLFAAYIRRKNYVLDVEDLQRIATNYGTIILENNTLIDEPMTILDNVEVKYKQRSNPFMYFDKYIGALIENNKEK